MLRRCRLNRFFINSFLNYALQNNTFCKHISNRFQLIKSQKKNNLFNYKYNTQKWYNCSTLTKSYLFLTSIWYKTEKEDVEENLAHLITLAKIALERSDIDRAKDILQLGLQLSEQHKLYVGVPYIYDILAAIAISQGNLIQAQELLVTAIEKLTIWGLSEEYYVTDFKLRLARIYSASGQNALAKLGFDSCLKQQQQKLLDGDTTEKTGILYVNILFWYGVHMIRNDKYKDAKDMINTAFEYSTKIKGLSPKQEMVILFTLADLNSELGEFDVALQNMENAIILGKGIGSIDLPVCYLKLGTIYEKLNYFHQAKSAYEEARRSAKLFGFFDVVADAEIALEDLKTNNK